MLKIRLARGGAKKKPFYFIVATDSRKRRDSSYIEKLGFYNPSPKGADIATQVNTDRLDYWLSQGANLSQRVAKVLSESAQNSSSSESEQPSPATTSAQANASEPTDESKEPQSA